jgi:hypothetical protein
VRDWWVDWELDLWDHHPMNVHDDDLSVTRPKVDLLVILCPDPCRDCRVQIEHWGPVPLTRHWAHEHEPILE